MPVRDATVPDMAAVCDLYHASIGTMRVMIGAVDADNEASLRFHERLGFREVAHLPEVGFLFVGWLDLVLVQRIIGR